MRWDLHDGLGPTLAALQLQLGSLRRVVNADPSEATRIIDDVIGDVESVFTAMRAGARGYVSTDAGDEEIMRAILAVGNGEAIFSPDIAGRMMNYFAARPAEQTELLPDLTASERNVLRLMAQGSSNEAIARELGFTVKTVRNYASNIFSKLQVSSRLEAVLKARDAGMA
jgi:DNA-binding NarL/FixJ family response regulator